MRILIAGMAPVIQFERSADHGRALRSLPRHGEPVPAWLLECFCPFNELTERQREIVAGRETIQAIRAGTRLIGRNFHDEACVYVVEGTLALTALDGDAIYVTGGTRRARLPISPETPYSHEVSAISDASVIAFNRRFIEKVNEVVTTYTTVGGRKVDELNKP